MPTFSFLYEQQLPKEQLLGFLEKLLRENLLTGISCFYESSNATRIKEIADESGLPILTEIDLPRDENKID